jgi:site-specific recombinase XerD
MTTEPIPERSQNVATERPDLDWPAVYKKLEAAIKVRQYSPKTFTSYCSWTRKLQGFTQGRDPAALTTDDVKAFLSFLAVERRVAASSQNQAFNALLFLLRHVLEKDFGQVEGVVRAKRKPYIPVVLSRREVDQLLAALSYPYDLVARLLYGCGLRLFECLQLRVQDLNLDMMVVTIHDGKGQKDRTVPLAQALRTEIELQLEMVAHVHQEDRSTAMGRRDYAILLLLARLGLRSSEVAFLELDDIDWTAGSLRVCAKGGRRITLPLPADVGEAIVAYLQHGRPHSRSRRLFLRHSAPVRGFLIQCAVGSVVHHAIERAGVQAPTHGTHQFRHALATGMLRGGASLIEIGELLGHRSPETTKIYTKVDVEALRALALPWPGRGE